MFKSFNTQPREGGCDLNRFVIANRYSFNTQPREGGCQVKFKVRQYWQVSTHSRAKAAAFRRWGQTIYMRCFNTQPREGGCDQ